MADRKSGPVKPPVIDLTARDATRTAAGGEKSAEQRVATKPSPKPKSGAPAAPQSPTAPVDAAAEPAKPADAAAESQSEPAAAAAKTAAVPKPAPQTSVAPPPRPQARLAMPWSAISIAAVGGALLGTGLTYLLATWISLPSNVPVISDPAPQLAAQAERISGLEERFATVEEASIDTQVSLDATITQLDSGFTELRQAVGDLRAAIPAPAGIDLSSIEAELRTLEGRVEAIAAGASSADADALAQNLVGIEQSLATLTTRMTEIDQQFIATDAAIDAFSSELTAAKAAIAAQNQSIGGADVGPAIKLPLVVSGLETALATGRPYAAELDILTTILPDLVVPAAVKAAANSGLARPDELVNRFAAALPDILSGRTGAGTGDWSRDALEWGKALLALRPAEEIEGDSPEAVISRLEAAMQRRDFIAATALLDQLPAPMRVAAGPLAGEISAHAEAGIFIARLRAQALAPVAAEAAP
ncbi:MAG: COG4223 family protein [Devosia sp.]